MTNSPPRPETIERLGNGVFQSAAMLAGMKPEVFTSFGDGPRTADEVAEDIGVGSAKLRPLLYALVVSGLLTNDGEPSRTRRRRTISWSRVSPHTRGRDTRSTKLDGASRCRRPNRFRPVPPRPNSTSFRCRRTIWRGSCERCIRRTWPQAELWLRGMTSRVVASLRTSVAAAAASRPP